jgi:predicted O-methyltransferase YrrM
MNIVRKKKIKSIVKKLFQYLHTPFIQFYKAKISRIIENKLLSSNNIKIKLIGKALWETINNSLSKQEQNLLVLIENRRSSIVFNNSKEDYHTPNNIASNLKKASMPEFWGILLFKLIRNLLPILCVELGTCVGISTSYQASALKMNKKGHLITLEGCEERSKMAKETFKILNLQNITIIKGKFEETFYDVLRYEKTIDFFLNDGDHCYGSVIKYYNDVLPYLNNEAVIVLDDISWSDDMRKAWNELSSRKEIALSIDLIKLGILLINKNTINESKKLVIPAKKLLK